VRHKFRLHLCILRTLDQSLDEVNYIVRDHSILVKARIQLVQTRSQQGCNHCFRRVIVNLSKLRKDLNRYVHCLMIALLDETNDFLYDL
jgi:hypothetical protein